MTTITVVEKTLLSFNEERRRVNKLFGKHMTGEEFVVFLLFLSRKVNK
jgi:hypothetical protein